MNFTMKHSALPVVMLMILSLFTMTTTTACTSQQFSNVVAQIQSQLPALEVAASAVLQFADPAALPLVGGVGAVVQADLATLQVAITAWQADQSGTNRQKIEAVIDAMVKSVDAQLLTANGLAKTDQQKIVLLAMSALATVVHVVDGFVINAQSAKQAKATAAARTAKLREIMPLLDRPYMATICKQQGVTLQAALDYQMELGY